jgi:hypothetical protein
MVFSLSHAHFFPFDCSENAQEGCIGNAQKHKGPVQALDFNPFQQNLLASGATDSEV